MISVEMFVCVIATNLNIVIRRRNKSLDATYRVIIWMIINSPMPDFLISAQTVSSILASFAVLNKDPYKNLLLPKHQSPNSVSVALANSF